MNDKSNILDQAFSHFLNLQSIPSSPNQKPLLDNKDDNKDDSKDDGQEEDGKEEWRPDVMVLGPGGIKAYLELGALLRLEEDDFLGKVKEWIGCSAGAVIALMLAVGYNITEIIEETLRTPKDPLGSTKDSLGSMQDNFRINLLTDITDIDSIGEIVERNGFFDNKMLEQTLRNKMVEKLGRDPTFEQLYMATGVNLTVVTYNQTRDRPEYLDKDSEPNLSCVTGTMMSINVPILMSKRMYKGSEYIDGALGNPYPVDIKDNHENKILGMYIVNQNKSKSQTLYFLNQIANASINQLRCRILSNSSIHCKHLALPTDISEGGTCLNNKDKSRLVQVGYEHANKFLQKLAHPEKYTVLLPTDEIPFDTPDQPLFNLDF